MSTTTIDKPMTVIAARAALANTRRPSSEQVDAAQRIVNSFYASKPRKACAACGCMIWSEHNGGVWGCDRCHRSPELTQAEFNAAETARREAADAHLRATEAAAPKPRDVLRERLAALAAAQTELAKIERAIPTARAAVTEAEARKFAAEAAAETSNVDAAEAIAASFVTGAKPTRSAPSAATARAELAAATDALAAARGARVLLDSQLTDARQSANTALAATRRAALAVLASEELENLLTEAAEARATYLESVGSLAWLIRQGAISSDARPRQLVATADVAPSAWPEARTADTSRLESALNALLANPPAAAGSW